MLRSLFSVQGRTRRWPWVIAALLIATSVTAQRGRRFFGGEGRYYEPIRSGMPERQTGFMFCRLQYTVVRTYRSGLGWSTDYPRSDRNFMTRLPQLTSAHTTWWNDGEIGHAVVRPTDPNLYRCPFLFASDPGSAGFSTDDAAALRDYLLKGGFLWVDDFWDEYAWGDWAREIDRVLPEFPIQELTPEHEIFQIFYAVPHMPQIPSMQSWYETGQRQERNFRPGDPSMRAIIDDTGRILVLMTHNTDIADGWEREQDNEDFFYAFTAEAYGVGINVAVWVMSH